MPSSLKTRHVLAVAGISIFLSFQNCAQPPDASESSASSSSFEDGLPLAYDFKLDTISHMSCSQMGAGENSVEPRAYYTFRAGAYNNATGGLSITSAFREATRFYSPAARAAALANSSINGNTGFHLALRVSNDLQRVFQVDEFRAGQEQESFLGNLNAPEVAGPLSALQPGLYMNYFPGTQSKRLIEASVRHLAYDNLVKEARDKLQNGELMLVAALGDSTDVMSTSLRAPSDSTGNKAYGSGFRLQFSLPVGDNGGERRVLAPSGGVTEIDLQTGQTVSANWNCSTSFQFKIVRPEDVAAGRVTCFAGVDRFTSSAQQAALNAVRRVLRVEDWYVDLVNRCVMPKGGTAGGDLCYGTLGGRTIQYGVTNCSNTTTTQCPHMVSVCIRN